MSYFKPVNLWEHITVTKKTQSAIGGHIYNKKTNHSTSNLLCEREKKIEGKKRNREEENRTYLEF